MCQGNFQSPEDQNQGHDALDRMLRELPHRKAPSTLMPRVMASIRALEARPWYRRAWWDWPLLAQIPALLLVSTVLGGMVWMALHIDQANYAARMFTELGTWLAPLRPLWTVLSALASAFVLAVHQLGTWVLVGSATLCAAMYLSCIGLGTMFYRVAFRR